LLTDVTPHTRVFCPDPGVFPPTVAPSSSTRFPRLFHLLFHRVFSDEGHFVSVANWSFLLVVHLPRELFGVCAAGTLFQKIENEFLFFPVKANFSLEIVYFGAIY